MTRCPAKRPRIKPLPPAPIIPPVFMPPAFTWQQVIVIQQIVDLAVDRRLSEFRRSLAGNPRQRRGGCG